MDLWYRTYQRAKLLVAPVLRRGVLSFEICCPGLGFFAHLTWCATVLDYCEKRHLRAQLSATSPHYRDPNRPANWLSYFFTPVDLTPYIDFRISQWQELCIPARYLDSQTIERTSQLVHRHMSLKPEIQMKIQSFCEVNFQGRNMLGVHFRGTDKGEEAPRVSWELMRKTVSNYLAVNRDVDGLFVASDEPAFRNYINDSFRDMRVICSQSNVATHHKIDIGCENYQKGEDALMDCLLLSHCSAVVRTTSFLSAWASIFNPKLPIVLVNRPYADKLWFPESALIPKSMDKYLPARQV